VNSLLFRMTVTAGVLFAPAADARYTSGHVTTSSNAREHC
jgi:hypothetical protein